MNAYRNPFAASLRTAVVLFLLLTALTGIVYPLIVTGLAQLVFPGRPRGAS